MSNSAFYYNDHAEIFFSDISDHLPSFIIVKKNHNPKCRNVKSHIARSVKHISAIFNQQLDKVDYAMSLAKLKSMLFLIKTLLTLTVINIAKLLIHVFIGGLSLNTSQPY